MAAKTFEEVRKEFLAIFRGIALYKHRYDVFRKRYFPRTLTPAILTDRLQTDRHQLDQAAAALGKLKGSRSVISALSVR